MIKVESLSKRFGALTAVDALDLDIKSGEFYCLLGPNGAGKTTTLKLLSGLMRPSSGSIRILGHDISKEFTSLKGRLGLIPDEPFLYENLTIREFLEFIGVIFAVDEPVYKQRIGHYLKIFHLENKAGLLIRDLSHGMKQRVSYIANFIHEPRVLLIDEPFVGLDPFSIKLLKETLKDYTAKGATILMSTHILDLAEELADRVGILDKGKLIAESGLDELRKKLSLQRLEDIFLRLTDAA